LAIPAARNAAAVNPVIAHSAIVFVIEMLTNDSPFDFLKRSYFCVCTITERSIACLLAPTQSNHFLFFHLK
jgi:hypothetical protein